MAFPEHPDGIRLYHFTHIRNLPGIVGAGRIDCDAEAGSHPGERISIAHPHLKERGARRPVPIPPGGTLADYARFYFASRSPMLAAIAYGGVEGYRQGQDPIVYLCSSVGAVMQAGLRWVATDVHAALALAEFFSDADALQRKVDWGAMERKYWRATEEDPSLPERRQAEFLVHRSLPWTLVDEIGVRTAGMKREVEGILGGVGHRPPVSVRPGWYLEGKP
ncbi:MAG: DUF4433 domain-containing protein [Planctomycetes bacterium]|nr:DUF4433 domain-containing protein [Planctomycetota bacterium]